MRSPLVLVPSWCLEIALLQQTEPNCKVHLIVSVLEISIKHGQLKFTAHWTLELCWVDSHTSFEHDLHPSSKGPSLSSSTQAKCKKKRKTSKRKSRVAIKSSLHYLARLNEEHSPETNVI